MKYHPIAVEQVRVLKKSKAALIETITKIDKEKEYLEHNVNSLFRYVTEVLGLSETDTCQLTQVVRKSYEVPRLKEAIFQGTLSVEKASRIASVITNDTQEEWIKNASECTHREIERKVRVVKPKELKKERIVQKTATHSELTVNISNKLEEKLKRLQEVFRTTSIEETIDKAFDVALKYKDPIEKAKRIKAKKINPPRTCKVQVEAQKPYLPASLKHQVVLRDKGMCQEQGCRSFHFTEIHHLLPLSQGGKHELSNLITLCSMHHSMRHGFQKSFYKKLTQSVPFS